MSTFTFLRLPTPYHIIFITGTHSTPSSLYPFLGCPPTHFFVTLTISFCVISNKQCIKYIGISSPQFLSLQFSRIFSSTSHFFFSTFLFKSMLGTLLASYHRIIWPTHPCLTTRLTTCVCSGVPPLFLCCYPFSLHRVAALHSSGSSLSDSFR